MTALISLVTRQQCTPAKLVTVSAWASARYETPPSRHAGGCGASTGWQRGGREEIIAAWNRRA